MMNVKVKKEVNHIVEETEFGTSVFVKEEFLLEQRVPEIKEEFYTSGEPVSSVKEELHVSDESHIDKVTSVTLALTRKSVGSNTVIELSITVTSPSQQFI